MASSRWHQDIEVAELIQHLDQPDKDGQWDRLTTSEIATVLKEMDRCRKDFVYAARNYFWISTKELKDQLFSLWPSQELILQKVEEIRAKGMAQKIIIIKSRQLGCSTLIEGLIAWRTMFFANVNALVVSRDMEHAAYTLYPIMQFIYDRMPWWLQPMIASRRAEEGLFFDNPKPDQRRRNPGLNSRVHVKGANAGGVGEGIRLSAVHFSEFAGVDDHIASNIIDEDMGNALVEGAGTFAILESTAKGANTYAHKLWKRCVELEDKGKAEWHPLFLPFFFDPTHVGKIISLPDGTSSFRPDSHAIRMRERILTEWVQCDNGKCLQYHRRYKQHEDISETVCTICNAGTVFPYVITDEQLAWIHWKRETANRDEKSLKKLLQEQTSTAEESFQLSGIQVFSHKEQEFSLTQIREPIAIGDFDASGKLHACNITVPKVQGHHGYYHRCYQPDCHLDHTWDDNPLQIWEFPKNGANYSIGGDVSEGLGGDNDYSVGAVICYSLEGGSPDYQVATWRSNTIDPIAFAGKLNHLGMFYNGANLAVECNKYDVCIGTLRFSLNYPNTYRWKHLDSVNINSNKLGWWTDCKSRPRLYQTFRTWLKHELFLVRSRNCYNEMLNFAKEEADDVYAGGDKGSHDDEIISVMIALYTAHEGSFSEHLGMAIPRETLTMDNAQFHITCLSCGHKWAENNVTDFVYGLSYVKPELDPNKSVAKAGGLICGNCGSRQVQIDRNPVVRKAFNEADAVYNEVRDWSPDRAFEEAEFPRYDML